MTDISVRGGSNGIEAHYDDMTALARLFGAAGTSTAEHALRLHGYLVDPDVLSSAVLDPYGAARFSGALLDALDGPDGLTWLAGDCAQKDIGLRAAAATYLAADRLDADFGAPLHMLAVIPEFGPDLVLAALQGDPLRPVKQLGTGLTDTAVDAISLFWTNWPVITAVAVYPDGRPIVRAKGTDDLPTLSCGPDALRGPGEPPRTLPDLAAGVAHRSDNRLGGDIDVRTITSTGPDGRTVRHVIVDIPGIDGVRFSRDGNPLSLGADARGLIGQSTSYSEGVLAAMRRAKVRPSDDVMLVGHSFGGMVAMKVAADLAHSGEFSVSHVLTMGAPVARIAVPRSVQVLSIENQNDLVTHLDGAANPDRTNLTTVTVNRDYTGGAFANHDVDNYVRSAQVVADSDDPSVRAFQRSLRGFLSGDTVTTQVFGIRRAVPPPEPPPPPRGVR